MKTISLLLMSLVLTTPVQAEEKAFTHALITPVSIRYGRVYELAKRVCPTAAGELIAKSRTDTLERLTKAANTTQMTDDERSLLFLMCDMYTRGVEQVPSP